MLDPELRSAVAQNTMLAMPGAVLLSLPLLMGMMPIPVAAWPESYPGAIYLALLLTFLYLAALTLGWRLLTAFRPSRPWSELWPSRDDVAPP
jgi:hypothetical protein